MVRLLHLTVQQKVSTTGENRRGRILYHARARGGGHNQPFCFGHSLLLFFNPIFVTFRTYFECNIVLSGGGNLVSQSRFVEAHKIVGVIFRPR